VRLGKISLKDLTAHAAPNSKARVIGMREREILTDELILELPVRSGEFLSDPERDIAKIAVYDRYAAKTKPAVGFLKGLGIKRGAISSTVSHDSHNLVAAGISDKDIILAVRRAAELGGGLVAVLDQKVVGELPLPIGGLMSALSLAETANKLTTLRETLQALGFRQDSDPYMSLAFMSLPVIPSLKLTSKGLVDVEKATFVPLSAD
jgi:adenine deaminase